MVRSIALDMPVYEAVEQSPASFLQADIVRQNLGITGAGVTVAVLDSGIDTDHPDLAGRIVAEQCFNKSETCPPDDTSIGASAEDENGHGTHVAGIIASQGSQSALGIAPGVNLVALRVLDNGGSGYTSDVLAGIDWIRANQAALDVKIINLSLGGGSYTGVCDDDDALTELYAAAVTQARQAGITLFAAAGNSGDANNLLAPACISGVVAVGNVYHTALSQAIWPSCIDNAAEPGQIACSSNSSPKLALLAPGTGIAASALGGGERVESGTSMSTPHAAAVAAMMLQTSPGLTPEAIEVTLTETGVPVTDPRNGYVVPYIDALAAVSAVSTDLPVTGTVLLEGRQDHSGTAIYVTNSDCESAAFSEPATFTDAAGTFSLSGLPTQAIGCIRAEMRGYLPSQRNSLPISPVTLAAGDLNQDLLVNILDLSIIAQLYQTSDPEGDLDASGIVNIIDLAAAAHNFGRQGPLEWP
jgi:subtilisin family serine protease